jgi:hypothetical protein
MDTSMPGSLQHQAIATSLSSLVDIVIDAIIKQRDVLNR